MQGSSKLCVFGDMEIKVQNAPATLRNVPKSKTRSDNNCFGNNRHVNLNCKDLKSLYGYFKLTLQIDEIYFMKWFVVYFVL